MYNANQLNGSGIDALYMFSLGMISITMTAKELRIIPIVSGIDSRA